MTLRTGIPPEFAERALALASESGRDAGDIIDGALRRGLDSWEQEYRLIQAAAQQADRGEFASDEKLQVVRNKYRPEA
ncbi:MAG: hypothetical protein GKR94_06475 [Gammaproteobacteria bacterium]|nr:hypothetical protein [Gammaproteobacteria bacterium]